MNMPHFPKWSWLLPRKTFPELAPPVMAPQDVASALRRLSDQDPTLKAFLLLVHSHWVPADMECQSPNCANREYWAGRASGLATVLSHIEHIRNGTQTASQ